MTDKNYIKDVFERPATRGEMDQSRRLRRLGVHPADISELRERLDRLRRDLSGEVSAIEERQGRSYTPSVSPVQKRYYDSSLLTIKPLGIIRQLISYRKAKTAFIKKYGPGQARKRISWSIWYLFTDGVLFFPSMAVYSKVQDVIRRQEDLRAHFRKMYSSGWLSGEGADVLTPIEFNLIAEAERLMSDSSIVNYLINFKHPGTAIEKMNPFLGYHMSISRDERTIKTVREAVEKSLTLILYPGVTEQKMVKKTLSMLDLFLDGSIERELLVPLFECAFCRVFDPQELKSFVRLLPIDMEYYRADATLFGLMSARKKKYLEKIKNKAREIEDKISFVLDIMETIGSKEEQGLAVGHDYLETLLTYAYHFNEKIMAAKLRNAAIVISDLCDIFFLQYAVLLGEEVKLKHENTTRPGKVFKSTLFADELSKLEIERHLVTEFIKKAHGFDIFLNEASSPEEAAFLTVVNSIVDSFFSIGIKLYAVVKGHRENADRDGTETMDVPMDERRMGTARIPCAEFLMAGGSGAAGLASMLANKSVIEAVIEIKKFCLCFAYKFEYKFRKMGETGRGETIDVMIAGLEGLYENLERLHKGESVE